jgi:Type VI secretion system/phage-baseplate injector OB domain
MFLTEDSRIMRKHQAKRYYGKYRGVISNNDDPSNLGRIKAKIPEILADMDTAWALPYAPYCGNGMGQFIIPPKGTGVWIEFEAGDISRPIWSGCFWGNGQLPKNNDGIAATTPLKIFRSESGLLFSLNNSSQTINVSNENGQNMLEIEVQSGKIIIKGDLKVIVDSPQIELVENAMHPLVFGDSLVTFLNELVILFNSHMHPGQLAQGNSPVTLNLLFRHLRPQTPRYFR